MKQRSLWRDARLPYLVLLAVMLALSAVGYWRKARRRRRRMSGLTEL